MRGLAMGAFIAALAASGTANAALVTETYDFTLGGFEDSGAAVAPPITTISGSFSLTFDPDVSVSGVALTTNSFSVGLFGPPFYYAVFPASGSVPLLLAIGDVQSSPGNVTYGDTNLRNGPDPLLPGSPTLWPCNEYGSTCGTVNGYTAGYTLNGHPDDIWVATTGCVRAVPEPGVWALLIAGGLGLVGRCPGSRRVYVTRRV